MSFGEGLTIRPSLERERLSVYVSRSLAGLGRMDPQIDRWRSITL